MKGQVSLMANRNVLIAIIAVLAILLVFTGIIPLGAVYPLETGRAFISGGQIAVTMGNGIPQTYAAFWNGGVVQVITTTDAPDDLEEHVLASSNVDLDFGSCGHGPPSSVSLGRGTGFHENKIIVNLVVPPIRPYFEGGQILELSPWIFSCSQDQLSRQNPSMIVKGSATFTKAVTPLTCEDFGHQTDMLRCLPEDRAETISIQGLSCFTGVCLSAPIPPPPDPFTEFINSVIETLRALLNPILIIFGVQI